MGNYVNTWYNWPVSQAAIRVKYHITPELYAQRLRWGSGLQRPRRLQR
ncbi:carbohydrate porin [Corynebacterium diphtheriae]